MTYLLGGYYLIKLRSLTFGTHQAHQIYSCSNCINDSLLDYWSYTWSTNNNKDIDEICTAYHLDMPRITQLRAWADNALDSGKTGWVNLFTDVVSAKAYRDTFFAGLHDVYTMAIYFEEHEATELIDSFKPENTQQSSIGLYHNLLRGLTEPVTSNEKLLGYDIIGVELDGSFHTFHCHNLSDELAKKFNVHLNQYGLYNCLPDTQSITDYMNDESNGFEPVPWFTVKTKLVIV